MERLIGFPMKIVAEGIGTRCPLYITCIDDKDVISPECELMGCEQCEIEGMTITEVADVFNQVTKHKRAHVGDGLSCEPIRLKVAQQHGFECDVCRPGIITTKTADGKDNWESIKKITQEEMQARNTKLLILLEPKEYSTNSIIDYVDETLRDRAKWLDKSIFLMTNFDLRMIVSVTGNKSNRFFARILGEWHPPLLRGHADFTTGKREH